MKEFSLEEMSKFEKELLNLDNLVLRKSKHQFSAFFGQLSHFSGISPKNNLLYGPNLVSDFHNFLIGKNGFERKGNIARSKISKIIRVQKIIENYQPRIEEEIKWHEKVYNEKRERLGYKFWTKIENIERYSIGYPLPGESFGKFYQGEAYEKENFVRAYKGEGNVGNGILDRLRDKNGNFGRKSLSHIIEDFFKKSMPREKFEKSHVKESPYKIKAEVRNFVKTEFQNLLKKKYLKKELKSLGRMKKNLVSLYVLQARFDGAFQNLFYSEEFFKDYLNSLGIKEKKIPVRINGMEKAFAYI
ncbi:hypothetical protein J4411_01340 [Candidatus Pacearchaeota archaeon]|nr:hypothetical protein [uncultured archaeon]MBS3084538.1 hypothetical protein [Candidatus Pacearchaeota archaeon]